MTDKLLGLLGIARRAGHTVIGFDAVCAAIRNRQARLVLIAADCSAKTEKELRFVVESHPCPLQKIDTDKTALAAVLGLQKPVAAIAIDDRGFAAAMCKHCGTDTKEDVAL